ncbi:hypothetical protein MES5069_360183 [Mesorhizobium escarrei]|uniref:Uncharacterized protein n=1 Tax=Mesorhizobium escarrei TaxID=666018 RepID=A0ABM9E240_9HYPH|nr:hypothetical protein MES5069_360183 [Mesorhizobium escarrei]
MFAAAEAAGRVGTARKTKPVDARPARIGEIVVTHIADEGREMQGNLLRRETRAALWDEVAAARAASDFGKEKAVLKRSTKSRCAARAGGARFATASRARTCLCHLQARRQAGAPRSDGRRLGL